MDRASLEFFTCDLIKGITTVGAIWAKPPLNEFFTCDLIKGITTLGVIDYIEAVRLDFLLVT